MIKVTIATEDGEVLDQFEVEAKPGFDTPVKLANAVRDVIDMRFETRDPE